MTDKERANYVQGLIKILETGKETTTFQLAEAIFKEIVEKAIDTEVAEWERLLYAYKASPKRMAH